MTKEQAIQSKESLRNELNNYLLCINKKSNLDLNFTIDYVEYIDNKEHYFIVINIITKMNNKSIILDTLFPSDNLFCLSVREIDKINSITSVLRSLKYSSIIL